ncbi:MAG: trypsin-like serine protease, partial [Pseudobdellovibrionaceae bacterium]
MKYQWRQSFYLMGVISLMMALTACQPSKPSTVISSQEFIEEDTTNIFGGSPVPEDADLAKAVFELRYQENSDHKICTASRISENTLITAAHCAVSDSIQVYQNQKLISKVLNKKVHPSYLQRKAEIQQLKQWKQGNEFDVALLFISENAETAVEFEIAFAEWSPETGPEHLTVAGFGWASYNAMTGSREGSNDLKQVDLFSRPSGRQEILSFQQSEGRGICVGDSGGPAFANESSGLILYGVAISVQNPGNASVCNGVSSFINVVHLRPWILEN